ncbi:MAG: hypothetical protein RLZZ601_132 [Pseudomonadota bacterium]|jgi:hypothetical protein
MKHWIYILSNPSYRDNLFKVGKSLFDVDIRKKQLSSSTGVPTDFQQEYGCYIDSDLNIEGIIHRELDEHRYNADREFFTSDLDTIVQTIYSVCKKYSAPILLEEGPYFQVIRHQNLNFFNAFCRKVFESFEAVKYTPLEIEVDNGNLKMFFTEEEFRNTSEYYRYVVNFMLNTFKNTRQAFPIFFDENSNVKKLQGEDIEGIKEYFMRELKPLERSLHLFFNFDIECEDALEDPWVLCECKPEKLNTRELFCPQLPQELKEHEHATTYPEIFNSTKEFIYI